MNWSGWHCVPLEFGGWQRCGAHSARGRLGHLTKIDSFDIEIISEIII